MRAGSDEERGEIRNRLGGLIAGAVISMLVLTYAQSWAGGKVASTRSPENEMWSTVQKAFSYLREWAVPLLALAVGSWLGLMYGRFEFSPHVCVAVYLLSFSVGMEFALLASIWIPAVILDLLSSSHLSTDPGRERSPTLRWLVERFGRVRGSVLQVLAVEIPVLVLGATILGIQTLPALLFAQGVLHLFATTSNLK